jgi:hypothetical protein
MDAAFSELPSLSDAAGADKFVDMDLSRYGWDFQVRAGTSDAKASRT